MSIHQYWVEVYILPKRVLIEIAKICISFLWSGEVYFQKPSLVAWDNLCSENKFGGLGFRNIMLWNITNMGRYMWAIAQKKDNAWIRRIVAVYMKNTD